jgi:4'-phosphopantetheinyl transferase
MLESHVVAWDWSNIREQDRPRLDHHVAVWMFRLDSVLGQAALETLSASEDARAQRFARATDRQHWVSSRIHLRQILGWLTGQPPAAVSIEYDARGKPHLKPHLKPHASARSVEFSVSHSGVFGMVAVDRAQSVGVDIEKVTTPWSVVEELLDSTMAPSERAWVLASPDPATAFARLWTRKEAVVKATGTGLLDDMRDVVVLGPSDQPAVSGIPIPTNGLLVVDTVSPIGYRAALAVAQSTQRVTVFVESRVVIE